MRRATTSESSVAESRRSTSASAAMRWAWRLASKYRRACSRAIAALPAKAPASSSSPGPDPPPGSERQGADHSFANAERNAQVMRVAELALALPVLRHHVADGAGLGHQSPPFGDHLAAEALADLDPRTDHRLFRSAGEPGQDERVPVDEPEAGIVDVEQAGGLLGDGAQQSVGRLFGTDLGIDVEERRHLIASRLLLEEQSRIVDGDGGVVGQ